MKLAAALARCNVIQPAYTTSMRKYVAVELILHSFFAKLRLHPWPDDDYIFSKAKPI
jgi:hypothetical protein